jgi:hypothetical protein
MCITVKEFRKVIWSKSKAFIQIRISELNFIGIKQKQKYLFSINPDKESKTLTINFKKYR